ncbi:DUF4012 domain-containing protein [Candidatus Peregrinibacteria bacterium]|nr:DUF4012 domain-containing protein [Candidatus Peregrinibacteria bacterium]
MAKKLNDIKASSKNQKIFLGKPRKKSSPKKTTPTLLKKESPISEMEDIKTSSPQEEFLAKRRPLLVGNLFKIAFFGFLIVLLANTINVYYLGKSIEEEVSEKAFEGYNLLIDAGKNASAIQFDQAMLAFESARQNFQIAEDNLWFLTSNKTFYSSDGEISNAINNLLDSGQHFAKAGTLFLEALENFNKIPIYFVNNNSTESFNPLEIGDPLEDGLKSTNKALDEIRLAAQKIDSINENSLPSAVKEKVLMAKERIDEINTILESTAEHFPAIQKLLGDRYPHRYLIIFQNNNEIRPTGGFIGSYAIMDINDGYIDSLKTYDSYDIDGSYGGQIEPPDELKELTLNWRFRDSNYSPDFPTSAKKMMWFLQKEGGPSVDTVIAINQGLLRDMLYITGPVQVGNFGKLNSENYNLLLSYVIEGKVWGAEDPKHILKVFVPAFKNAILKEENIGKVSSKLYKAVQQKHIMVYSKDEDIQNLIEAMGLDGSMHRSANKEDYVSVINFSLGGSKSEQFIEETILHESHINSEGNIVNEVSVTRSHEWSDQVYNRWKEILADYGFTNPPQYIFDILGRGENKVLTKIYAPAGSKLIKSNKELVQTKFDKDTGKTYFLTRMSILAGEEDTFIVRYQLPYKLDLSDPADTYRLVAEKQAGSRGSIFTKTITTDEDVYNLAVYPEEKVRIDSSQRIIYATDLVYDKFFSAVFTK